MLPDDLRLAGKLPTDLSPAKRIAYELMLCEGMISASSVLLRVGGHPAAPVAPMIKALILFCDAGFVERVGEPGQRAHYRWKGPNKLDDIGPTTWASLEEKVKACFEPEQAKPSIEEKKELPMGPTIRERLAEIFDKAETMLTKEECQALLPTINPPSVGTTIRLMYRDGQIQEPIYGQYQRNGGTLPPSRKASNIKWKDGYEPKNAMIVGKLETWPKADVAEPTSGPVEPPSQPAEESAEQESTAPEHLETGPIEPKSIIGEIPLWPQLVRPEPWQKPRHSIEIPIPGKSGAVLTVPEDMDEDDWIMVCNMLHHYVKRWKGFKGE